MVSVSPHEEFSEKRQSRGNVRAWLVNAYTVSITYDSSYVTMEDIKDSEQLIHELLPDCARYVIADMPRLRGSSPGARRHPPLPHTRGVALIYASPVGRMIAQAYLRLKGSPVLTRLFKNRESALRWLEEMGPPTS